MTHCVRRQRTTPDPLTGEMHEWIVTGAHGPILWQGYTGPLRLDQAELTETCRGLLGVRLDALQRVAAEIIDTSAVPSDASRLFLHSTTPAIHAFEADLAAMTRGQVPSDLTTYTETRALYLARPGDLAVGRTYPWRLALARGNLDGVTLGDTDYYYLSHALLRQARDRGCSDPALSRVISYLRDSRVGAVSVYALEPELQLLLCWLAREAGLARVRVDANDPRIAAIWNRKRVLHPTVDAALALGEECSRLDVKQVLELEQRASEAFGLLSRAIPVVPGYVIPEHQERKIVVSKLKCAADLLRGRYGLSRACLKPSEGGDGGRIVPDIELGQRGLLEGIGENAWAEGGDYLLEAHVDYLSLDIGDECLYTTPSAHIFNNRLLDGLTLQFMRGTSWKGNIYVDEASWRSLGLEPQDYASVVSSMSSLADGLGGRGLACMGVDFAIGRIGGRLGDSVVVAIQDINMKLPGAMFLREFMNRHKASVSASAATRVFRPHLGSSASDLLKHLTRETGPDHSYELIAVVPGRWGMFAMTGASAIDAATHVLAVEGRLMDAGLVVHPPAEPRHINR